MLRHDTVRRALRTFLHAGAAGLVLSVPTDVLVAAALRVELAGSAAFAALSSLLTWLHGELEDAGRLPDTRHPTEGHDDGD